MRNNGLILVFLLVLTGLTACAKHPQAYVDESIGLGYVKRIAILPFENHTSSKLVEERIRDIVGTEILSQGLFELVEKGDVQRFLREEVVSSPTLLDVTTAQRMARDLNVEAYLAGSVDDYSEMRNGPYSYPVIALTFRLVDAQTGKIIWQATGSESGYSTWDRMFGFASDDVNQVSFKLVKRLLDTIYGG